jgi:hypothetical protein
MNSNSAIRGGGKGTLLRSVSRSIVCFVLFCFVCLFSVEFVIVVMYVERGIGSRQSNEQW